MKISFKKLNCIINGHDWDSNKREYIEEGKCNTTGVCLRCGKKMNEKIINWHRPMARHKWGEIEYSPDDKCQPFRKCTRCGDINKREKDHDWSPWKYEKEGKCGQVRTCKKCSENQSKEVHQYESVFIEEKKCNAADTCKRCGDIESKYINHQFKLTSKSEEEKIHTCERCKEVEKEVRITITEEVEDEVCNLCMGSGYWEPPCEWGNTDEDLCPVCNGTPTPRTTSTVTSYEWRRQKI